MLATQGRGRAAPFAAAASDWSQFRRWFESLAAGASAADAPMAHCTWAYSAIRVIAQTVAGLEWSLTRGARSSEPLSGGPAVELLTRPNEWMSTQELLEELAGHLVEGGEAHAFDPRAPGAARIRRLEIAGRRQMTPRLGADGDTLLWWEYRPPGGGARAVRVLPEELPYIRLFNPYDPWRGLSPADAAQLGISQDYRAARFNERALANGGRPGGIWVWPGALSTDERDEYLRVLEARHGGEDNANRDFALGGGVEYKQLAFSNVDLSLLDGRRLNREEVFAAYGVPPVLGNVFDSAHYNVADAAQEIFLLNTIAPLVQKIEGLFNTLILPRVEAGVQLSIALGSHPVMRKIERSKLGSLRDALRTGVPYNEAVAFLRLPFERQSWGDQSFIETGLETPAQVIEGVSPLAPAEDGPETEGEEGAQARRQGGGDGRTEGRRDEQLVAALREEQRSEERQIARQIPAIRSRFRAFFLSQERRLIARLRAVMGQALAPGESERAWERAASEEERLVERVLLRITGEQTALRKMVIQYLPRAIEETLAAELTRLGVDKTRIKGLTDKALKSPLVQRVIRAKQISIANIERTTRERVRRTLLEGAKKSETLQELADRVRGVLGVDRSRALTIARTEAGQAVSTGRFTAAAAAGATGKGWLHGANPRPSHVRAQERYHPARGAIAMGEAFEVGAARLMYPRDPRGGAAEVINCNCVLVTVRLAQRRGDTGTQGRRHGVWEMVNASWGAGRRRHRRDACDAAA